MKRLVVILLITSACFGQKTSKVIVSFNSGELSPLMDARIDQAKYLSGCRTMENYIPLIYGGAQRRPGTEYIANCKSHSAKSRLVAFEHSVDDTYILEFANQIIRVFRDGGQVLDNVGTEDISSLDNITAHWLLNDFEGTTVLDDDGGTHNGTASTNASTLSVTGKVNDCFDLDGQYTVSAPAEGGAGGHADFSFTDDSDDTAFSFACWGYVEAQKGLQVLLSKWRNENATREWRFSVSNTRKLQLHLADTSGDLSSDRVAHWKLDEDAADKNVLDEDATSHDGLTQVDDTADLTTTGKVDACLDFGGADAVVITADHAELSFVEGTNGDMSIAAWIFVTDTSRQTIISKDDLGVAREWKLALNSSEKLELLIIDDSANKRIKRVTNSPLTVGWRFVVATYNGENGSWTGATAANYITLYVDGAVATSSATNDALYVRMEDTATKAVIGATYESSSLVKYFADKIDNVMIYSTVLTLANVQALYNSGEGTSGQPTREVSAVADTAITLGWHFLSCTYSAPSDETTAADGIILYVDGVAVDSTATNDVDYNAMQGGAEEVRIGSQRNSGDSANENFWDDKIDEVSIFSDVLTPTEVASLYSTTVLEITSPYLTADLFQLKFEQSADVMFIDHPDYEPRKLSRLEHDVWTLVASDIQTGPFRTQNTTLSKTITPSATTGSITLTAIGHTPFVLGTTAGHEPSGSSDTSMSQTGALYKIVHAVGTPSQAGALATDNITNTHTALAVPKGVTWDFTTNGTWGTAANSASVVLERSYDAFTTKETIITVTSAANKNVTTSGTETFADATYRARVSEAGGDASICSTQLSVRDTSHIGIVEITSVTSPTEAIGTVLKTLGATDLTHRWSEGSFSNYRGWPIDITISAEERLTFTGNKSEPLTTWGSESGDFTNFVLGTNDSDPIQFTLVGTGQQNRIRWVLSKDVLVMGTVGGEHLLGASRDDEALTPTNVRARLQTTHGSKDIAALIVNQAVLFVQRGGRKIREFLYSFETDSYNADDLTVFSNHITESGIVDMDYQRTPDPMLWCVRDDGEIAVMSYERKQNVFSWCRFVTSTGAGDSDFESVAIIYGGDNSEDEVWVTVERVIDSNTVRYVERFFQRAMPADMDDMKYLDSFLTYDSTDTNSITGLTHLEGETVQVLGGGLVQATKTVSGGAITIATNASTVQVGLGYTSTLKPMKLDIGGTSLTTTKRINRCIVNLFETIQGEIGPSTSKLNTIKTGTAALFTGIKEVSLKGGYSREGDIMIQQTDPLPSTILSLNLDVGAYND